MCIYLKQRVPKQPEKEIAMEEIKLLIFHGCRLARELEANMNQVQGDVNMLSSSCEEIIRVFSAARERLNSQGSTSSYGHASESAMAELEGQASGGVQEWLRYSYTHTMTGLLGLPEIRGMEEVGGRDREAPPPEVVEGSGRVGLGQRARRRNDDVDNRKVWRVPAPRMGNTEIPPEDGYTWRKYGQKEILNSRFPRSYFRCTHQKLYQCPAKKQVQRLDDDPFTFEVTYRGDHTCIMSSTAPSAAPPPLEITPQQPATARSPPQASPASVPITRWLTMDINPPAAGEGTSTTSTTFNVDPYGVAFALSGRTSSTTAVSGGAGSSSSRYGSGVEFQLPLVDLADALFNSGVGGSNSMDMIFSSMEDEGEQSDKKS
ncbi:WRKY transcription factor 55-like [Diospyros lotus]|uniref:WRKY transcription factor 55-like n=1 Tax=Diospyros lotus TaxID=55363 RepID=UPI0022504E02|nr:WRKY transcription factor 55-like [Diospyros lotus]